MKIPFCLLRTKLVNAANHLNPRLFSSFFGSANEGTSHLGQEKAPPTSHILTPAYFFFLFSRRCHLPIYSLLHAIDLKRPRHPLSETLRLAGISRVEFAKWQPLMKERNILTAVEKLYQEGYITSEANVFSSIGPDEDGVYYTPSGGKWSNRSPIPTWVLMYLVAYKVRAPHHAQGQLLDLVFSHLDFMQPNTGATPKGYGLGSILDDHAFGGPRAPLLILTMLHLARFRRPLAMPHVVERFLSLPELMQFRIQREAKWNEACFNSILQAALINTPGFGGSSLSPSSATLSPQVARVLLPVILILFSRQLHLYLHTYNLILQPANVALVVELAKHLRAKAMREGHIPTRKQLETWAKLVFTSDEDSARADVSPRAQDGSETAGDPTSPFEFLRKLLRSADHEALRSAAHNAGVKASVATLKQPKSAHTIGKGIPEDEISGVVGALAERAAGGKPPPVPIAGSSVDSEDPTQIWTRAFTLAAKDTKAITSRMLVYFFKRAIATFTPQTTLENPPALKRSVYAKIFSPGSVVLSQPIRLTVAHYTTLLRGLVLRGHYPVAEQYFFSLLSTGLPIDARALGAGLVILTRLAKVGTAFTLLEKYASSGDAILPLPPEDRKIYEPIRMNTIQFNDFFVALIRFPTMHGSLALPPPHLPFMSPSLFKREMHSARPDVVLSLFDAMGPLYGVWPDERSVCLMLQAARMVGRMNDTVLGGWRQWNNLRMAKSKPSRGSIKISPGSSRQAVVDQIHALLWEPSTDDTRKQNTETQLQPRAYSPGTLWAGELPFERARKAFHRLVWAHAQSINTTASKAKVDLSKVRAPARAVREALEPDAFSLLPKVLLGTGERESVKERPFEGFALESVPRWYPFDLRSAPLPRLEATTFHQYILLLGVSSVNLSDKLGSFHTGIAEIPLVLAWMRALGITPMRETLAAALVLWAEATGRPPLFDDIISAGKLLTPDSERAVPQDTLVQAGEGEGGRKFRSWRPFKLPKSEYTKLLEWMVEWVEELRTSNPSEVYKNVEMPTPWLIWKWSDIIRLMRHGNPVEEDVARTDTWFKEKGEKERDEDANDALGGRIAAGEGELENEIEKENYSTKH